MIRTDQSPLFGTHVIRGLTDKFNHHGMNCIILHVFQDSRSVFCALPLPHTLKRVHAERESERERNDSDTAFQTMPQRTDTYTHTHTHTHTQSYVKIPVLASILVNTVGYVLS